MFAQMQVLNKNTQIIFNNKPNLVKKLWKVLRVVANFKNPLTNTLKDASTFRVFIRRLFKGASTHKTSIVTL